MSGYRKFPNKRKPEKTTSRNSALTFLMTSQISKLLQIELTSLYIKMQQCLQEKLKYQKKRANRFVHQKEVLLPDFLFWVKTYFAMQYIRQATSLILKVIIPLRG